MRLVNYLKARKRVIAYGLAIAFGVFLVVNAAVWGLYRHRTYPNSQVAGQHVGSKPEKNLEQNIDKLDLLPAKITLVYGKNKTSLKPADLGVKPDTKLISQNVARRHWLPVYNLVKPHNSRLELTTDDTKLQDAVHKFAAQHKQEPLDARPVIRNGSFELERAAPGKTIDGKKAEAAVISALMSRKNSIELPIAPVKPKVSDGQALATIKTLQAQQKTAVTYTYQGKNTKPTPSDISGWYSEADGSYSLNDAKIQAYVVKTGNASGIRVKNTSEAIAATKKAVQNTQALTFELAAMPKAVKNYTYCTAARGVDTSQLPVLESKLSDVFQDLRGWGLDGRITYSKGSGGCNFIVWLSSSGQVPSFGSICDTMWSCTVGPNVIINFDRWQSASPAWNNAGGNLDDYRNMVINHEVGHWLGFGHRGCGGAGQPAPIMQQQSIDLQGCAFNAWPLASERNQLSLRFGL